MRSKSQEIYTLIYIYLENKKTSVAMKLFEYKDELDFTYLIGNVRTDKRTTKKLILIS